MTSLPAQPPTLPVALGRHALALVAQDLQARGVRRVAVPAYHCLTMTLPFQLEGLRIECVPVGPDLMAQPEALHALVTGDASVGAPGAQAPDPATWAILHCEVFGAPPSDPLRAVLEDARAAGATLIVDDTHRWPLPPHVQSDDLIVSTRKLLGLPDGGLVSGAVLRPGGPRPAPRGHVDEAVTEAWLAGNTDRAEDLMDQQLLPVSMSSQALQLADGIDLAGLVVRRRTSVAALHDALVDRGLTPISPRDGHFCVAFRHPDADRLIVDLARAGVDGPVWWPRPTGWQGAWPDDVVTLPVGDADANRELMLGLLDRALRAGNMP
jgi:hypothetical protein